MKNQKDLHEIIAELAMMTELKGGPNAIIGRIKKWFSKSNRSVTITGGRELELNANLLKTSYQIGYPSGIINLSFLFHKLSKRWYIDRFDPA